MRQNECQYRCLPMQSSAGINLAALPLASPNLQRRSCQPAHALCQVCRLARKLPHTTAVIFRLAGRRLRAINILLPHPSCKRLPPKLPTLDPTTQHTCRRSSRLHRACQGLAPAPAAGAASAPSPRSRHDPTPTVAVMQVARRKVGCGPRIGGKQVMASRRAPHWPRMGWVLCCKLRVLPGARQCSGCHVAVLCVRERAHACSAHRMPTERAACTSRAALHVQLTMPNAHSQALGRCW